MYGMDLKIPAGCQEQVLMKPFRITGFMKIPRYRQRKADRARTNGSLNGTAAPKAPTAEAPMDGTLSEGVETGMMQGSYVRATSLHVRSLDLDAKVSEFGNELASVLRVGVR